MGQPILPRTASTKQYTLISHIILWHPGHGKNNIIHTALFFSTKLNFTHIVHTDKATQNIKKGDI